MSLTLPRIEADLAKSLKVTQVKPAGYDELKLAQDSGSGQIGELRRSEIDALCVALATLCRDIYSHLN
jgi:hypothetical protein